MQIISFVTQKGESGRSTLALRLGEAAHAAGERVCVIDLVPNGAPARSFREEHSDGDVALASLPAAKLSEVLAELSRGGTSLAILDSSGGAHETAAAINAADLCVVPLRPTAFDLWAAELTFKAVCGAGKRFAFVIDQSLPSEQGIRLREAAHALEAIGALVGPIAGGREDSPEASRNAAASGGENNEAMRSEMRELWNSLGRRLETSRSQVRRAA
ncbi:MAG: ParA family protein [Methylobacteriaceae bacterium]|nr:ParA family protein [Methylobacteriaceae bacterium]